MNKTQRMLLQIAGGAAVAAMAVFVLLTPGGETSLPAAGEPVQSAAPAPVQTNGDLILGYTRSEGFNPYVANSSLVLQSSGLLFERLVDITPTMELDYRLAQSIDTTDRQVIITLRGGCSFADGTPITAADAAACFSAAQSSAVYGGRFANVERVRVVENSLVLTLKEPDSLFAYLCDIPILKAAEVSARIPTASGRYTYGEEDTLIKNARAPFPEEGPTPIRLSNVSSYDEMVSGLAVGNLNLYAAVNDEGGSAGSGKESYYKTNQMIYMGVNSGSEKAVLARPEGRALLSRIIDRRRLAEKSYYSRAYPATGAINSFYPCVNSQQKILAEQDLTSVEETLQQLGYGRNEAGDWCELNRKGEAAEPLTLGLLVYGGNIYKHYAAAQIAEQMATQGIAVTVTEADSFETYRQAVQTGQFELYIGEVKLYNDMDLTPFFAEGALSVGLAQSDELDAAYQAFRNNKSAAGQFEQVFAAQMPFVPLLWRNATVISGFGVQGLNSSLSNIFYSVSNLTVTNASLDQ